MTSFEPEALGNLVEGLEFHKFFFDNRKQEIELCAYLALRFSKCFFSSSSSSRQELQINQHTDPQPSHPFDGRGCRLHCIRPSDSIRGQVSCCPMIFGCRFASARKFDLIFKI